MPLPADSVDGIRDWYRFRDFPHFVEVYVAVTQRIKTVEDLELCGREFVDGQADQNIVYSEVTYTASTIESHNGIPWRDQLQAMVQTREYAKDKGIDLQFILDIVRGQDISAAETCVDRVLEGRDAGVVCALGLAGEEWRGTRPYAPAIRRAEAAGVPFIPHAGETCGPDVIWECLEVGAPPRIGHGVRSLEDPALVRELLRREVVLEVCPTSNVALGVVPSLSQHQLPQLLQQGVAITLNSDDPPMFGTTLTDELYRCSSEFRLDEDALCELQAEAARASCLPAASRASLEERLKSVSCA